MDHLTQGEQEMLWQYCTKQASPTTHSPPSTQMPLSCPSVRGTCTPSSVASPLAPSSSLPVERLTQCNTIKQQYSIVKSSTEDSSAEGIWQHREHIWQSCWAWLHYGQRCLAYHHWTQCLHIQWAKKLIDKRSITVQRTKVNSWEILVTKLDILFLVMPSDRYSTSFVNLILTLEWVPLSQWVFCSP